METTVGQLLDQKGTSVCSISSNASIQQCALHLREHGVGSLLILDSDKVVGILYERDIARYVVANNKDPATVLVAEVMCREFASISRSTLVSEAMQVINDMRVRHLPVIEAGKVCGMISIGDLNHCMLSAQKDDIDHLVNYISGTTDIVMDDNR